LIAAITDGFMHPASHGSGCALLPVCASLHQCPPPRSFLSLTECPPACPPTRPPARKGWRGRCCPRLGALAQSAGWRTAPMSARLVERLVSWLAGAVPVGWQRNCHANSCIAVVPGFWCMPDSSCSMLLVGLQAPGLGQDDGRMLFVERHCQLLALTLFVERHCELLKPPIPAVYECRLSIADCCCWAHIFCFLQ
jgi:hypothetical protein